MKKFNQILKRLDTPRDDLKQNYSKGRKNSERGEYSKKYYPKQEDRIVSIRENITQKNNINQESQSRTQTSECLCWCPSDQNTKS